MEPKAGRYSVALSECLVLTVLAQRAFSVLASGFLIPLGGIPSPYPLLVVSLPIGHARTAGAEMAWAEGVPKYPCGSGATAHKHTPTQRLTADSVVSSIHLLTHRCDGSKINRPLKNHRHFFQPSKKTTFYCYLTVQSLFLINIYMAWNYAKRS